MRWGPEQKKYSGEKLQCRSRALEKLSAVASVTYSNRDSIGSCRQHRWWQGRYYRFPRRLERFFLAAFCRSHFDWWVYDNSYSSRNCSWESGSWRLKEVSPDD